jgi:hypothetical protein
MKLKFLLKLLALLKALNRDRHGSFIANSQTLLYRSKSVSTSIGDFRFQLRFAYKSRASEG